MVFLSIVVSIIAVVVGLNSSIYYDVATGPAIVIALGVLFAFSQLFTSNSPTWRFFKPSLSPARTRFKEITHWAKIGFC
jgi:hypothetical protein